MSGAALAPTPPGAPQAGNVSEPDDLFTGLVVSNPPKARRGMALPVSLIAHGVTLALIVLVPVFWSDIPPEHPDYVRALLYNPPPPPPPPLPKGSALIEKAQPAKPVTPDPKPEKPIPTTDLVIPKEEILKPEARDSATEQAGSQTGSDIGVPEGMDVGVEGGVVGGVPGGVLGGVIGGTGDGPVMDYDQPPRGIKITRPQYPQDAFVKKIEGTVELEILIDSTGRVVAARIVRSIPLLDAAAKQTVMQWIFSPAIKNGRPVATLASAPVTFRIF